MSTPTTEQECERIARECAEACAKTLQDYDARKWKQSDPCVTDHILTAAARITALKVRESGAVEALDRANGQYDEFQPDLTSALTKLRSLQRGEG